MNTLYMHNVTRITLKPIHALGQVPSMARDIVIEDEDGGRFEITLFGTESGLGIIEEHADA
jgi:hypothetical protein